MQATIDASKLTIDTAIRTAVHMAMLRRYQLLVGPRGFYVHRDAGQVRLSLWEASDEQVDVSSALAAHGTFQPVELINVGRSEGQLCYSAWSTRADTKRFSPELEAELNYTHTPITVQLVNSNTYRAV